MPLRTRRYAEHVPRDARTPWFGEHLARYRHAAHHAEGARVLDVACGPGIGFHELHSSGAQSVVGVDLDVSALTEATKVLRPGLTVVQGDGVALPLRTNSIRLVTCFETIEHVQDDAAMVAELARVLAPDGTAYVSTPNALATEPIDGQPRNPFHVREHTPEEFRALLDERFQEVALLGQLPTGRFEGAGLWRRPPGIRGLLSWLWFRLAIRSPPSALRVAEHITRRETFPGADDFGFDGKRVSSADVLLAVCRKPR